MFEIKVNFDDAKSILKNHGLDEGGKVQKFFADEVLRCSDPYVPADEAMILKDTAYPEKDGSGIIYDTPYARYHWYGKLMVDPITGKGSFYNPKTGRHWSRKNVQKVLTDKDMKYRGSPMRGPKWVERMWIDRGQEICQSLEAYVNRGAK